MARSGLKWELAHLRKAFLTYHQGWRYFYQRYFLARKIFSAPQKIIFQENQELSVHMLVCHRDFIMSFWSLISFCHFFRLPFKLFLHSDGSLSSAEMSRLKEKFPQAEVISPEGFSHRCGQAVARYPALHKFVTGHPNYYLIRKIIDPYFISDAKYLLIIDSDMLWFKEPSDLSQSFDQLKPVSFMMWSPSPGPVTYADGGMLGAPESHYNSGIVFYKKELLDLDVLGLYLEKIDYQDKKNFQFIEEAGFALSLKNIKILPPEKYLIKGAVGPQTIARHYTSPRRANFYIEGLNILKRIIL